MKLQSCIIILRYLHLPHNLFMSRLALQDGDDFIYPTCYVYGDSDVILFTTVTAAMLEVYYVAAVCKLLCV